MTTRVFLLLREYELDPSQGPNIDIKNFTEGLSRKKHIVYVFSKYNLESSNFIIILNIASKNPIVTYLKKVVLFFITLLKNKYDVIIISHQFYHPSFHNFVYDFFFRFAITFFQKKPIITFIPGSEWMDVQRDQLLQKNFKLKVVLIDKLNKRILNKSVYILTSPDVSNWLINNYNIPSSKFMPLIKGIDLCLFNWKKRPYKFKNIKSNRKILFVGDLEERNGVNMLIDAFSIIYKRIDNVSLIIVGDGDQRKNMQKKVDYLGINNRVFFLGKVKRSNLPNIYAASDVVINPKLYGEGFANVHKETMAMKKPMVSYPTNTLIEKTLKMGNGLQARNEYEFADMTIKLLEDKKLHDMISESAYEYVKHNESIEKMVKYYNDIFEKIKIL
jgi:glycosyltransferase involved in cell wall biosynthesis